MRIAICSQGAAVKRVASPLALICLLVACGYAQVPAQQLAGARQVFDGTMLPRVEVATFENSDTLFPVNQVPRGGAVRTLSPSAAHLGPIRFQSGGKACDLYDYLAGDRVAGIIVLKNGQVVFED